MGQVELGIRARTQHGGQISRNMRCWRALAVAGTMLGACAPARAASRLSAPVAMPSAVATVESPSVTLPHPTPTPQITATPVTYRPQADKFHSGINPLSGLPVVDTSLLKIPAVLVSISHFPATARPQAGLSFAPFVYEFSITGGETRFLAAFYGQFPEPEVPVAGDCPTRGGAFEQTGILLGNQAWWDHNHNGVHDPGEGGLPGICVDLLDPNGRLLESTTTDTNGMYGFNVVSGKGYVVKFQRPTYLDFTKRDVGTDESDSDVDLSTGATPVIEVSQDSRDWDAGFVPSSLQAPSTPNPAAMPRPEVGPVRSGRLHYTYIGASYHNSCLIFAFASRENLEKIPLCASVPHEEVGGGEMLPIDRMRAVAEDNTRHTAGSSFDYSSNPYAESTPAGGTPAAELKVFFSTLNQSGWTYDPLYQAYLRFVDTADKNTPGVLHADVDRLTGRQLHFENIVLIMVDEDVVSSTNLNIRLDEGNTGPGTLFRNGQAFPIKWSTRAGDYERKTGFRRPLQFLNPDGSPAPLRPGHTWVIIVTPFSPVERQGPIYSVRYAAPEGEAR